MKITVEVKADEVGIASIHIEQIGGTDNYKYDVDWAHENGGWYGTIYNHEDSYLELVKKVLNGRDLS